MACLITRAGCSPPAGTAPSRISGGCYYRNQKRNDYRTSSVGTVRMNALLFHWPFVRAFVPCIVIGITSSVPREPQRNCCLQTHSALSSKRTGFSFAKTTWATAPCSFLLTDKDFTFLISLSGPSSICHINHRTWCLIRAVIDWNTLLCS